MEIVLIVVQITDYLKIIGKGIQPDIGILQKFLDGDPLHLKLPAQFPRIIQKIPVADAVGRKKQIKGGFGMLRGESCYILAQIAQQKFLILFCKGLHRIGGIL